MDIDLLFKQYYERLILFAESYVADLSAAEDIVQDVFLSLLSKKGGGWVQYDRSYLYSCVKNACIDYLRSLKIKDKRDSQLWDAVFYAGATDFADMEELLQKLEAVIDRLPEQRKQVLQLSIYQNKSYAEIAEITGLSVNTIKTHIKYAYRDIRKEVTDEDWELIGLLFVLRKRVM